MASENSVAAITKPIASGPARSCTLRHRPRVAGRRRRQRRAGHEAGDARQRVQRQHEPVAVEHERRSRRWSPRSETPGKRHPAWDRASTACATSQTPASSSAATASAPRVHGHRTRQRFARSSARARGACPSSPGPVRALRPSSPWSSACRRHPPKSCVAYGHRGRPHQRPDRRRVRGAGGPLRARRRRPVPRHRLPQRGQHGARLVRLGRCARARRPRHGAAGHRQDARGEADRARRDRRHPRRRQAAREVPGRAGLGHAPAGLRPQAGAAALRRDRRSTRWTRCAPRPRTGRIRELRGLRRQGRGEPASASLAEHEDGRAGAARRARRGRCRSPSEIVEALRAHPAAERVEVAGSLRRLGRLGQGHRHHRHRRRSGRADRRAGRARDRRVGHSTRRRRRARASPTRA